MHIPGTLNRPADTLSRYPALVLEGDEENLPLTAKRNPNIYNKTSDDDVLACAEFVVGADSNPMVSPPSLTLIRHEEQQDPMQDSSLSSIRTNTPDHDDPEDISLWSPSELQSE